MNQFSFVGYPCPQCSTCQYYKYNEIGYDGSKSPIPHSCTNQTTRSNAYELYGKNECEYGFGTTKPCQVYVYSVIAEREATERKAREEKEAAEKKAHKEAFEKLSKVAEEGDANAQYELGLLYFSGTGVLQDSAKAYEWINKAAEQGNEQAKNYLAERDRREKEVAAEKARKEKEAAEIAAKKERARKIGRVIAALLMAISFVLFMVVAEDELLLAVIMAVSFMIPFLVIFFCKGGIRNVLLVVGILWGGLWLFVQKELSPLIPATIGFIASYIIAMIFPRQKN